MCCGRDLTARCLSRTRLLSRIALSARHRQHGGKVRATHDRSPLVPLCDKEALRVTQGTGDAGLTFPSAHKRSKSGIARSLLQRVSSRQDVPTLGEQEESATSSPVEGPGTSSSNLSVQAASSRASTQTQRPHLTTIMSNTVPTDPSSPARSTAITTPATPASAAQGQSIESSVRLFKIFEALRNGDTAAIAKATKADDAAGKLEGTTTLHLAIQCAEQPVIEYVLSNANLDLNARDRDGSTPLHLASMLGRAPVVKLLVEQPAVNDSIANYQGKTPLDLARNPEIFQQLQLARSIFIDNNVRKVHAFVHGGDYAGLEQLLGDSRVQSTLDINGPELATEPATTESGGSLLHEAARKRDTKLAQMLLLNGADPFRRDRKGKLPQDVTKDDRTRAILKKSPAAAAAQRGVQEKAILGNGQTPGASQDGAPGGKEGREMKGYLKKWTNYTSGYKLRWFVLEDGVLSYYKHQDDAGSACRGAINMRIAKLHMDPKDKLMFEIHGKSSVKYHLKANHQVEAKRWFWSLNNAIQWTKDEAREEQKRQKQESAAIRQARSEQADRQQNQVGENNHLVPATPVGLSQPSAGSSVFGDRDGVSAYAPSIGEDDVGRTISRTNTVTIEGDADDDDEYGDDASSHELHPANRDAFSITAQSAKLQLDLLGQVSAALQAERTKNPELSLSHPTVVQALSSYDTAVGNLKGLLVDLLRISKDHEAYWQYRLDREANIRRLWEDSMARVAQEQEVLESRIGESEDKRKRTKRALREALEGQAAGESRAGSRRDTETERDLAEAVAGVAVVDSTKPTLQLPNDRVASNSKSRSRRATIADLTNNEVSDDDSDEEEEFFDAVGAGEVEIVDEMPKTTAPPEYQDGAADKNFAEKAAKKQDSKATEIEKSYKGYEDGVRKRLKLDADNRPKISLWGVLKSMIGKDMTKMTLPVQFNEPTSLLYRVVEDMEYTDLLNEAVERSDSTERMVYVAGFAASEYASTIGRVAKPFNPLLGETYEYVRPDQGYRFFIEQVSHHPPIGAAYAESARWDYYVSHRISF